ncbi:mannitol dehydrogenase [Enterococcus sp. JM4C]|uniref:mannitol dehydrogenase family protein n=1 Tax=Candidatus Enterococcus huntleyi TaxID=1857217 RepID=UPI00137A4518|nr:mannitol dehydrogenase family protein [Enterococcus sp. JM4C]KAF1296654.1 mannitol dehydrogenase [Enterococcus sp. JM4C]
MQGIEKCLDVQLPLVDKEALVAYTKDHPQWVHFGGGNLFRAFHAEIAQELVDKKEMQSGVIVCETFDEQVIEKAYQPYNNNILEVIMHEDGKLEKKMLNAVAESYYCHPSDEVSYQAVQTIFEQPSLQMVTVTITEKGYALANSQGELSPLVKSDIQKGPNQGVHTMSILASLLFHRFNHGAHPIAMISTDNFSRNGQRFQESILQIAKGWVENGFADAAFIDYLEDTEKVTFPWSMIDRITPNPSQVVADKLTAEGITGLSLIHTDKGTNIAPFANTEATHYLVIEDSFPNGRPALDAAGVILTTREIVDKTDAMKVTTCLNPLHTAMSIFGCLLDYQSIAEEMKDEDIVQLIKGVGYVEGLPVVEDPEIIQPKVFIDEVITKRLPNPMIPDMPQRIAADTSQKVAIRFGETIKKYLEKGQSKELIYLPLSIAGWLRYLLGVNDQGEVAQLSPDPLLEELQENLSAVRLGFIGDVAPILQPILSNRAIFGVDLYEAGLGEKIEGYFKEMIEKEGAVRKVLHETVQ